mmetsp:Transcript_29825/g.44008  ORF Transcript_29825/g.44008 Transcript_29825/m.44008 type:complete len:137 (-) Transcript_29825:172-582(-)
MTVSTTPQEKAAVVADVIESNDEEEPPLQQSTTTVHNDVLLSHVHEVDNRKVATRLAAITLFLITYTLLQFFAIPLLFANLGVAILAVLFCLAVRKFMSRKFLLVAVDWALLGSAVYCGILGGLVWGFRVYVIYTS